MSHSSHGTEPAKPWSRLADMPLRLKLYLGLGALIAGLLLVSAINTYASIKTQQLVSRTLVRQRQLADLAADVNNTLLNVQNQAFKFYDTWTLTGFEKEVSLGGFDYAREIYLNPLQEQLEQIRDDIAQIQGLEPDPETYTNLEEILTRVDTYEITLLEMSDQMEQLGFGDRGELGQIRAIRAELQSRLAGFELVSLQTTLLRIRQYEQDFFLSSNFAAVELTRESINQLNEQIAATDDAQLSPTDKAELNNSLERYYDHFLTAAKLHRRLQDTRPILVIQSDMTSTTVRQLFEQQQAEFSASVEQLQRQQSNTKITTVGLALVALVGGSTIAYFVTRQTIRPIQALGQAAGKLGAGDLTARAPIHGRDEIGTTAAAFNLMADQLQELLSGLERQAAERTADLEAATADLTVRSAELEAANQRQAEINRQLEETVRQSQRRAAQLQASAEVSHAVAQIRDLDQLLPQVTQLISQHFGFYHTGIFLIDEVGRYAVLRAANSKGGQRMLARRHKLEVGSVGIVGYVTGTGQPRIALDVGEDAVYFENPDLPNTRSEMAIPLRSGDQTIGALDVQSTAEAAFSEEDLAVLTALADQVTIAIENAHLFQQSQAALEEAEQAQRRYLGQEWAQFTHKQPDLVHEYTLSGVSPLGNILLPETEEAWRSGELVITDTPTHPHAHTPLTALAAPIKIRDQVIGVLDLQETETQHVWTDDEVALVQAVADQLGQALESARLFEETQQRARREAFTRQITDRIRGRTEVDAMLQTAIRELAQALGAPRVFVHLAPEALMADADAVQAAQSARDQAGSQMNTQAEE